MRALVFSDVHAHPFKYGAKDVPISGFSGSFNSRLADTVLALEEMVQYAQDHKIKHIWFCGDMFHTKNVLNTEAYSLVHSVIARAAKSGIKWLMIPGNHDYADRNGDHHSLAGLSSIPGVTVSTVVEAAKLSADVVVMTVPYTDYPEQAKEYLSQAQAITDAAKHVEGRAAKVLLLAHLGVQGSLVGSDYVLVSDHDIAPSDLPGVDFAFFGHYHEHQHITSNSVFVGALTQHNWGDMNGKRGFLDVTIEEDITFVRVETSAPKFVKQHGQLNNSEIKPNDFVRLCVAKAPASADLPPNVEILVEDTAKETVTLDTSKLAPIPLVEEWVKLQGNNDEHLLRLGKELIAAALAEE